MAMVDDLKGQMELSEGERVVIVYSAGTTGVDRIYFKGPFTLAEAEEHLDNGPDDPDLMAGFFFLPERINFKHDDLVWP